MKKILKRSIAMLCICILVMTSNVLPVTVSATDSDTVSETEQITLDDMGYEFTRISLSDFGITKETTVDEAWSDGSQYKSTNNKGLKSNWDKTLFYGSVKFSTSTSDKISLSTQSWGHQTMGVRLEGTGSNIQVVVQGSVVDTLSPANVPNRTTLTGVWLDIAISIEVLTSTKEVRVGIFIDGNLYNNTFITTTVSNTGHLTINRGLWLNGSGSGISVKPNNLCGDPGAKITYTLSDLNMPDYVDKTGDWGVTYTETLLNKQISMIISAGTGNYVSLMPHSSTWGGLQLLWQEDSIQLSYPGLIANKYLTPSNVNISGTYIMDMIVREVDYDYDGTADDILIGIWFNHVLCGGDFYRFQGESYDNIVLKDNLTNNKQLYFHSSEGGAMSTMSVPKEKPECELIDITQTDFATNGIQWQDKRQDANGEIGIVRSELASGLLGTKLNVDVMFPESGEAKFLYGATAENDGLSIYSDGQGDLVLYDHVYANAVVATLTPEKANATLVGERINLQISYEDQFTVGETGVSFDAILGIYINGNLYNNEFLTLTNVGTKLGNGIATQGTDTDVVTIWMPLESKEARKDLTPITLSDFGIADNQKVAGSTGAAYKNGTSLLNTVFTMKTKLYYVSNSTGYGNVFSYGAPSSGSWYGLQFKTTGLDKVSLSFLCSGKTAISLGTFTSQIAGTDLVHNDMLMQISLQPADFDRDGTQDDMIMGVFFDKKLYNNRYIYIQADGENLPENWLGKAITLASSQGKRFEYYSVADWSKETYLFTAPEDYGVANGTYTDTVSGTLDNTYSTGLTMNGKVLKTTVTFADHGEIAFAGKDGENGFKIYRDEYALYFASVTEGIYEATKLDTAPMYLGTLDNMDMELEVSVEYQERDGNGDADDVKIGIWIQDMLCNDTYFYVDNCTEQLGSELRVKNVTVLSEERQIPTDYDYTQYTFDDYVGLDYITYKESVSGTITGMVSDEAIYTDKVQLSDDSSVIISGYTLTLSEQTLKVLAGDKLLAEKEVEDDLGFALVTKRVDVDKDGARDDVQLSVYVDGQMYENRYFYLIDYQTQMNNVCEIVVNDAVTLKELYEKPAMPICLDTETDGYTLPTDKESIVVNRATITTDTTLDRAGDYRITYTETDGTEVTHVVACYHAGDANIDNQVDTRDLISYKKAEKNLISLTKAGMHATDLNNDDGLSKEDGEYLRELLVGKVTASAIEEENATTTFGVISDVHLDHVNDHREDNLCKALEYYREKGAKLIIVNGDVSDYGTTASYNDFVSIFEEVYPDAAYAPKMIMTADNHEYFDAWNSSSKLEATKTRFFENLITPLNTQGIVAVEGLNSYAVVDGYHFIGISSDESKASDASAYSETTINFLKAKLAQAAEADATKPIFVAVHQPPTGTVAVPSSSIDQLITLGIFDEYPQAVIFTSHTHNSIKSESSIWKSADKKYTVVNTGSLYYVGSEGISYTDSAIGVDTKYNYGEGLLVNVRDNVVVIDRRDFFHNEEIKTSWILNDPENPMDYTDARKDSIVAPVFDSEDITVRQMTASSVRLTFDSASHKDFVHHYKVKITNQTDGTTMTKVYKNDFFTGLTRMAKTQNFTVSGLKQGAEYTFEITAVETFGKESDAITTTYTMN